MKKKIICTALATMVLLSTTVSAESWWLSKYRVTFDNELGIVGNVTLQFAADDGSFIRPIQKDTAKASILKVTYLQNMVTHSRDGLLIHEQSRIR